MDLLSSIRKSGSRGGVNFSWDEVQTSQHRENYLGHSLMAPVGRWQKGRDLNWYAKGDDAKAVDGETADEKWIRERKEEIRRIKEAEEDALAKALGLPVKDRSGSGGIVTGSNNISVGEMKRIIKETEDGDDEIEEVGKEPGFGDFVGKVADGEGKDEGVIAQPEEGGLLGRRGEKVRRERSRSREHKHRHRRHRDRSGERTRHRDRDRDRSRDRHRSRRQDEDRREYRERPRSSERGAGRHRNRSLDRPRSGREYRESRRESDRPRRRSISRSRSRSRSPRRDLDDRRRR